MSDELITVMREDYVRLCDMYNEKVAEIAKLREALEALADNVESIARDSFATGDGSRFEEDFKDSDSDGYAVWKQARAALGKDGK